MSSHYTCRFPNSKLQKLFLSDRTKASFINIPEKDKLNPKKKLISHHLLMTKLPANYARTHVCAIINLIRKKVFSFFVFIFMSSSGHIQYVWKLTVNSPIKLDCERNKIKKRFTHIDTLNLYISIKENLEEKRENS